MIPTYNQSKFLVQAINSALGQDYPNYEIIISDDCSSDDTQKIIKQYLKDPRIKYYRNKKNIGRVKNYNTLLYKYAKGEWVINLDGDDYFYDKNYLTEAITLAQKDEGIAFVFGDRFVLDEESQVKYIETNSKYPKIYNGNDLFLNFPSKLIRIPHLSIVYNREKALKIGFYTMDIISSDWESFLRLMINNKVAYIKKTAGVWRKHKNNESKSINFGKVIDNLKLIDSVVKFITNKDVFNTSQIEKWENEMTFRLVKAILSKYLLFSNFKDVIKLLKTIKHRSPKTYYRLIFNIKTHIEILLSIYPPLLNSCYQWKKLFT